MRRDPEASPYCWYAPTGGVNSLLNKVLILAGTAGKVGSIRVTYDTNPISLFVPFPTGFTDQFLPRIINSPGAPRIICGDNVSLCWTANQYPSVELMLLHPHGVPVAVKGCRAAHEAIAAGAECIWLQKPSSHPPPNNGGPHMTKIAWPGSLKLSLSRKGNRYYSPCYSISKISKSYQTARIFPWPLSCRAFEPLCNL